MKELINGCLVLAIVSGPYVSPAALSAQESSPSQREVLAAIDEYTRASIEGDVEDIMGYFHAEFRGWDYGQDLPLDRPQTKALIESFYANNKLIGFDTEPLAVQLRDDMAVVYLRYRETMMVAMDEEVSISGRWTATLVREGDRWLFMSWTWLQD